MAQFEHEGRSVVFTTDELTNPSTYNDLEGWDWHPITIENGSPRMFGGYDTCGVVKKQDGLWFCGSYAGASDYVPITQGKAKVNYFAEYNAWFGLDDADYPDSGWARREWERDNGPLSARDSYGPLKVQQQQQQQGRLPEGDRASLVLGQDRQARAAGVSRTPEHDGTR